MVEVRLARTMGLEGLEVLRPQYKDQRKYKTKDVLEKRSSLVSQGEGIASPATATTSCKLYSGPPSLKSGFKVFESLSL